MKNSIYFGSRGNMQWIPAPDRNVPRGATGYTYNSSRLDGSAGVKRSVGSHREYDMSWSLAHSEPIDPLLGYANGDYGPGPFYWVDPWAADTNILPDRFASPGKFADPENQLPTPENPNRFPVISTSETSAPDVWIPVPDGMTLHVGVHGAATGSAGVVAVVDGGASTTLTAIPETSATRTNYSFTGPGGVTLTYFGGVGGSSLRVSGVIAQILPSHLSVPPGGWLTAQGSYGCEFSQFPEDMGYIKNRINELRVIACTLREVV